MFDVINDVLDGLVGSRVGEFLGKILAVEDLNSKIELTFVSSFGDCIICGDVPFDTSLGFIKLHVLSNGGRGVEFAFEEGLLLEESKLVNGSLLEQNDKSLSSKEEAWLSIAGESSVFAVVDKGDRDADSAIDIGDVNEKFSCDWEAITRGDNDQRGGTCRLGRDWKSGFVGGKNDNFCRLCSGRFDSTYIQPASCIWLSAFLMAGWLIKHVPISQPCCLFD